FSSSSKVSKYRKTFGVNLLGGITTTALQKHVVEGQSAITLNPLRIPVIAFLQDLELWNYYTIFRWYYKSSVLKDKNMR
ncbi:11286_t:CDS:1, partial [Gigaspora margarita]